MSGYSTPKLCQLMLDYGAGMVILGAYAFDQKMHQASLQIMKRGRLEFILPTTELELEQWLKERFPLKKSKDQLIAINARIVEPNDTTRRRLELFLPYVDVIELNAHCRQQEVLVANGGQALLKNLELLEKNLKFLKENFPTKFLGIKIRAIELENVEAFCEIINANEIDFIHVDCMVKGQNIAEPKFITNIREKTNVFIIANNNIRTKEDIKRMLNAGANAVSVARPLINDPTFIKELIRDWKYLNLTLE